MPVPKPLVLELLITPLHAFSSMLLKLVLHLILLTEYFKYQHSLLPFAMQRFLKFVFEISLLLS